jgi:hypothetical protein
MDQLLLYLFTDRNNVNKKMYELMKAVENLEKLEIYELVLCYRIHNTIINLAKKNSLFKSY